MRTVSITFIVIESIWQFVNGFIKLNKLFNCCPNHLKYFGATVEQLYKFLVGGGRGNTDLQMRREIVIISGHCFTVPKIIVKANI